ncbi:pyridoxal phosphate-dependent aminotransferase [Microvirga makkahensis]|uniref:Aminotransferase n=1 Tax=Microvirga makkahensis TaxID=1128670 RepID=A0A7X3MS41_9HYPH|nr:pyridoxal phosphate-dependent aminotransferase [Microvirga makkahensis]MXQ12187.1 aminotransferase class I/II-fold pyridoxal phosphate-dependent enzyme [Microvirga makkahensis]
MKYEADLIKKIKASPAMAISMKARQLSASGVDVVDLSVGEPDFATPAHIVDAAIAAMRRGDTHYTAADGTAELKDAIVEKFRRENDLDFSRDQISAANGAKQIIFNALMATLEPGDEVVVPTPYWVSYTDMVTLLGGTFKLLPCGYDEDYKLTPEKLDAALSDRTRWLLLNAPNNPSGAGYTRDEMRALGDVVARYPNVLVLSDEIYEQITYGPAAFCSFLGACPELRDRVVLVNGVSKAYAMTGWRIGFAAGPAELISVMAKIQSQSTSNPCSISQAAAAAALTGPQDFVREALAEYKARRDLVLDGLRSVSGLRLRAPEGAFYVFPECSAFINGRSADGTAIENDTQLAAYLLQEARVAVVPGAAFGSEPCFRISFATSRTNLEKAVDRIGRALTRLT